MTPPLPDQLTRAVDDVCHNLAPVLGRLRLLRKNGELPNRIERELPQLTQAMEAARRAEAIVHGAASDEEHHGGR